MRPRPGGPSSITHPTCAEATRCGPSPHSFARRKRKRRRARKGSIAVQGVSLTVNEVRDAEFDVNLIPHTVSVTTLRNLKAGSKVNLEVDLVARYVERMLSLS